MNLFQVSSGEKIPCTFLKHKQVRDWCLQRVHKPLVH